ncbi:MAG: nucleoside triphosphate pyrophosphohydrolase [Candidatus Saccharimonadales bacterium]
MKHTHTETDLLIEKQYPKLVRDRIPEMIERDGKTAIYHREEDNAKYLGYLFTKLLEEATELTEAATHDHRMEEIADVKEVLISLQEALGVSEADVEAVRKSKSEERGGFSGRLIVDELPQ